LALEFNLQVDRDEAAFAARQAEAAEARKAGAESSLFLSVHGTIDHASRDRFAADLARAPYAEKIWLHVDSNGGDFGPSYDLWALLHEHPAESKTAWIDRAESGALLAAAGCDQRAASHGASILFHGAALDLHDSHQRCTAAALAGLASDLRWADEQIVRILSKATGADPEELRREMQNEEPTSLEHSRLESSLRLKMDDTMSVEEIAALEAEVRREHARNQALWAHNDRRRLLAGVELKAARDGSTLLYGVATSDAVDRMGDIVEADGMQAALPVPFLLSHDHSNPLGKVLSASRTKNGIEIEAKLFSGLADRIDEGIRLIKAGLYPGLSIGFRALESKRIPTGLRFTAWELLEISAVSVPANPDGKITAAKCYEHVERKGTNRQVRAWL